MENYWQNLHKNRELSGLQVVCCPELPLICNEVLHSQHKAAFNKLLCAYKHNGKDLKALDVGCGFGRWCAEYEKKGISAYGIDIGGSSYIKASATKIPFRDKIFDIVSTVTVLQHLDKTSQEAALSEIDRVSIKGSALLLMEHVCDVPGKVWEGVFPRTEGEWVSALENMGYFIKQKIYFQYTPIMTTAIKSFNIIEKLRKGNRKAVQSENKVDGKNRSAIRTSLRLRFYRKIKAFTLSVAAASDYLITGRGQFKKGSHLGLLAVKIDSIKD
ncbi:MAG: class I SAM-dependent methyltransferase [Fibrobacteres bacterium]|nr:class I SAM-dependent methyltransferase [Fibrobacterota bacterium]